MPLDSVKGSEIGSSSNKKPQDDIETQKKSSHRSLAQTNNLYSDASQASFSAPELQARKIENIDHFLTVNSDKKCRYIAREYLSSVDDLTKNPDAVAYDFLKVKQKIPAEHIVYNLFPYLALNYMSDDEAKLTDNLINVFTIAKSISIENLSNVSFADIVNLKNTLKARYQQANQENLDNRYLDETDKSYIQETTAGTLSKTEVINRVKRSLLRKRYAIFLEIVGIIFSICLFYLPDINTYAIISIVALFVVPIIYSTIAFSINKVKIIKANNYIVKNLDKGLEILNANKELSTDEAKRIQKLRNYYAFLFESVYSSEIRDLYAEIEKLQIEITSNSNLQNMKDEIYRIKAKEKIKIKQQNINEYLQLYERIYFLTIKEHQYNVQQFEKVFTPRFNDNFYSLTTDQQQQVIDKVFSAKGIQKQTSTVELFTVDPNTQDNPEYNKQQKGNLIINGLSQVLSFFKNIATDRVKSSLEYSGKIMFAKMIAHESISNIFDIIKTPFVSIHGYYLFFFSMIMNAMEDKFTSYRDTKRILDIKLGKPEITGLFFGIINPRLRTNREQIVTIIDHQKKNSMLQLKLMKRNNNNMKKYTKLLQKNKNVSPEKLVEMLVDLQYYYIQSVLLANNTTIDFLQLIDSKIKELQLDNL